MAVQLVFLSLWLCNFAIKQEVAAEPPLPPPPLPFRPPPPPLPPPAAAIKNCKDRCGNVTIPFPFGIGKGCFLNDWYEILCQENGTVPRLKKIDLEVLNISLPHFPDYYAQNGATSGTVEVRLPIIYSNANCTHNKTMSALTSLEGGPFSYSSDNTLLAIGCNQFMVITNANSVLRGCASTCKERSFSRYSNCSGSNGCCRTDTSAIQEFSVHFLKEAAETMGGNQEQECSYAFLASQTWLVRQPTLLDLYGLISAGHVPGVLSWGIFEGSLQERNSTSTSCYTIFETKRRVQECICLPGYWGNPYLKNGCRARKICKEQPGTYLCHSTKSPSFVEPQDSGRIMSQGMIGIGSGLGTILLLLLSWKSYDITQKRREIKRKAKFFERNGGIMLQQQLSSARGTVDKSKLFSCKELEKATDSFNEDRVLGQGGQGTVYKGMLADGRIVAIKKSEVIDGRKVEQFINEVLILSLINHRNVVKLLGCCLETEIPLLVYEFVPNGTLYEHLHEPNEELVVSWDTRLRLAREVAAALSYLHSAASIPIYHRDIKSTNILLDEKYRAKVADFGTSRSVSLDQTHLTTLVKGTFGYLDPEYFQSSQFTDKSDVYSFGVVLVELLTGQKPISSLRAEEGRSLATYFIISMEENKLLDILDPRISLEHVEKEDIEIAACLAKRCLSLNGRKRPTMKEVAMVLEGVRKPINGTQHTEELSRCFSMDQASEISEDDSGMPTSTYSEVAVRLASMSDIDPLISGRTW